MKNLSNAAPFSAATYLLLLLPFFCTFACKSDDEGPAIKFCTDRDILIRDIDTDECTCNTEAGYKTFYDGKVCVSSEELDQRSWKVISFTDPIPNLPYEQLMFGGPLQSNGVSQNGNLFIRFPDEFGILTLTPPGSVEEPSMEIYSAIAPDWCIGHPNHNREVEYGFSGAGTGFYINPYSSAMESADEFRFSARFTDIDGDCRADWSKATGFIRNDTMYGQLTVRQFTDNGSLTREPTDTFRFVGTPYGPPYPHVN